MRNLVWLVALLALAALGHSSLEYSGDGLTVIEARASPAADGLPVGLPVAFDCPAHSDLWLPMHWRSAERPRLGVRPEHVRGRARLVAHWGVLGGP